MVKHIPFHRGFINFNTEMKDKYFRIPRIWFEKIHGSYFGELIMIYFRFGKFRFYANN
jgi:hypothetical protein